MRLMRIKSFHWVRADDIRPYSNFLRKILAQPIEEELTRIKRKAVVLAKALTYIIGAFSAGHWTSRHLSYTGAFEQPSSTYEIIL